MRLPPTVLFLFAIREEISQETAAPCATAHNQHPHRRRCRRWKKARFYFQRCENKSNACVTSSRDSKTTNIIVFLLNISQWHILGIGRYISHSVEVKKFNEKCSRHTQYAHIANHNNTTWTNEACGASSLYLSWRRVHDLRFWWRTCCPLVF